MTETSTTAENAYTNVAEGDAHVDTQIGVVHGDANFYQLSGATREEKYRVGRNYLEGNMPRQAEGMIREAFMAGYKSNEVAYYWALAVLSNRPFDHLSGDEFDQLAQAFAVVRDRPSDGWAVAVDVVAELVSALTAQEQQVDPDPAAFARALDRYSRLPAARREELRRHLEMILAGGLQDQMEAHDAAEVERRRMGNDRTDRVWKFFEDKPIPPRITPPENRDESSGAVWMVVGGTALLLLCVYLGGPLLLGASSWLFALAILLIAVGSGVAVTFGLDVVRGRVRRSVLDARQTTHPRVERQWRYNPATGSGFSDALLRRVQFWIAKHAPEDPEGLRRWNHDTRVAGAWIAHDIAAQFGEVDPVPRVAEVEWLIRWRCDRVAEQWRKGRLRTSSADHRHLPGVIAATVAGIATCMTGFVVFAGNLVAQSAFSGVATTFGLGGASVMIIIGGSRLVRRTLAATHRAEEAAARLREERKAYADWWKSMEDRPTDAEMAIWLDYDKAYLKAMVMRQSGFANRDLIGSVILVEGASSGCRARVLFGPLRHSRYILQVFLLSESGIRHAVVDLDFGSGIMSNENRSSFRYEAISSAKVEEAGIRIGSGPSSRSIPQPRESEESTSGKLVLSQELRLTLNNQQWLRVVVGNYDEGLIDRLREDPRTLLELARDSSGINAALRILEAIASEGGDWVKHERERRRRRIIDYQRRRDGLMALPPGGVQDPPTVPIDLRRTHGELGSGDA
ncbi:hypothetical protein [Pseudonocardia endophytica]|uniref:Uncharacterized protein n=1 Tax=Pseudonocardia endophytica TaxID=401976 RepID=A0A4R1HQP8_PSEEN|nr:hypothetical protein [Pseudonocardia endophytica]TCK24448.1 hypothetical protein EV378_0220 [Pseudonocardia endophytica]